MVFCRLARSGRNQFWALAHVAQLAEHVLGKDEVISSILIMGSSPGRLMVGKSQGLNILQVTVKHKT